MYRVGLGQGAAADTFSQLSDQQLLAQRASVGAWNDVERRALLAGMDPYALGLMRSEFYWRWALLGWPGDPIPGLEEFTITPHSMKVSAWYMEHVVRPLELRGYDSQPYAWPLIGIQQDGSGPPTMKKVLDAVAEYVTYPALPAPFGKGPPAVIPTAFVTQEQLEADWARQQADIAAAIERQKVVVADLGPAAEPLIPPGVVVPGVIEEKPEIIGAAPEAKWAPSLGTVVLVIGGLLILRGALK